MKLITAVIKPYQLDAVKDALQALQVLSGEIKPKPARVDNRKREDIAFRPYLS